MVSIRLDHVSVTVSDLERSLHFYQGLLGMKQVGSHDLEGDEISRMANKPKVRMKVVRLVCPETPDIQIDLQQYLEPKGKVSDSQLGDVANSHFCVEVADVDEVRRELETQGVEFIGDTVHFDLEDAGKISCVFFKDPDGYVLELASYRR